jgi:putative transposase
MDHPERKQLPHQVPPWIDPNKEIYFLTICCGVRGKNQLALEPIASGLFDTVTFRNENHLWFAYLFLLMPDHAHALMSFPPSGKTIKAIVGKWKEWTAKHLNIQWQRDFFEHRLRQEESRREKADYILNNPVRAGLVQKSEQWPFVWFPNQHPPSFPW